MFYFIDFLFHNKKQRLQQKRCMSANKQNLDSLIITDKILLYKEDHFVLESSKAVGVQDSKIVFIGEPSSDLKAKKTITLKNHVLLPGLINTHTHLAMSLFRGLADNLPFMEWLENYIFPLEKSVLNPRWVRAGTALSAVELIHSGVTTCCDMYFYNKDIASVLDQSGLRAFVGVAVPSVESDWEQWEQKALDLKQEYKNSSRIEVAIAPHAPYTVTSQMLKDMGDFSKKEEMLLSIHASESLWEQQEIKNKYGKTPVQYLHDLNVTGKHSIFAHCIQVDSKDLDIMAQTQTSFSHNPESNLKLSNGIAPVGEALKKGVVVGLGTDGSASNNNLNMFEEMATASKLQALKYGDQSINAEQTLKMATIEAAKALGIDKKTGSIEIGKQADLIAVDLDRPHFYPPYNIISHLIYSANGSEVSFVMCDGKILMEKGEVKTLDQKAVCEESLEAASQINNFLKKK